MSRSSVELTIPVQSYSGNYHSISKLGNGSFGSVELAKFRRDRKLLLAIKPNKVGTLMDPLYDSQNNLTSLVAIKTMKKRLPLLDDYTAVKEIKFLHAIGSHPGLMQVYEIFIDDVNYQLHISMEAMNQNLYQLMRARRNAHFSPTTIRSILCQILGAIRHIHKHDFFHRDVKPENILVVPTQVYYGSREAIPPYRKNDNYVVKLADYGLARHIRNHKTYTAYVSTRWYRSPEILLRQKWYSQPIDIWAFGCVAAEVANFAPLFPGSNELDQIWKILKYMGSPNLPDSGHNFDYYFIPLGGYWRDAKILASRLGFNIPHEPGLTIAEILPNPTDADLREVVKACLTWDPTVRPNVEKVCSMPYFGLTPLASPYREPERPSAALLPLRERTEVPRLKDPNVTLAQLEKTSPINHTRGAVLEHADHAKENYCDHNLDKTPVELMYSFDEDADEGYDEDNDESNDVVNGQLLSKFNPQPSDSYSWIHTVKGSLQESSTENAIDEDLGILNDVSFGSEINVN